jgi:hypothetical protein
MSDKSPLLDDVLRNLAASGDCTYVSLVPKAGPGGPGGIVWSASFSPASKFGTGFAEDADIVQAVLKAVESTRSHKLARTVAGPLVTKAFGGKKMAVEMADAPDFSEPA